MNKYLAIQHTYDEVQLGLFQNSECIHKMAIHKHDASSLLAQSIKNMLHDNETNLTQLSFIAINQGPGPFTTLRVVISSVNALGFAVGLPMVGVDGIKTLAIEHARTTGISIALLNAFNQDVYFALSDGTNIIQTGYDNINYLLDRIQSDYKRDSIHFFGNAASLHQESILRLFPNATIDNAAAYCSLEAISKQALSKWKNKEYSTTQLQPLYLKSMVYKNSIKVS